MEENNNDQIHQKSEIQYYLQLLKKKVDHHIKNPFDLPFANYSHEELYSWKNNILQLDATSKLYGQRVDYLHMGAIKAVSSVIQKQSIPTVDHREEIRRNINQNSDEIYLENSEKLNGEIETMQTSFLLWKFITSKCEKISELVLNIKSVNQRLELEVLPDQFKTTEIRLQNEDQLKTLKIKYSYSNIFFTEMSEVKQSINSFHFSQKKQTIRQNRHIEMDFVLNFDQFQFQQNENQLFSETESNIGFSDPIMMPVSTRNELNLNLIGISQTEQSQYYFDSSDQSNYDSFKLKPYHEKKKQKKKSTRRNNQKRYNRNKEDHFVQFDHFVDKRREIFQENIDLEKQRIIDNLVPKEHLPFKIIKNLHFLKRKNEKKSKRHLSKKHFSSKIEFIQEINQNLQNESFIQVTEENPQSELNFKSIQTSFLFKNSFMKQGSIPIKQLKKKINNVVEENNLKDTISFSQVKESLSYQNGLDIFTGMLHFCAQKQIYLKL